MQSRIIIGLLAALVVVSLGASSYLYSRVAQLEQQNKEMSDAIWQLCSWDSRAFQVRDKTLENCVKTVPEALTFFGNSVTRGSPVEICYQTNTGKQCYNGEIR